MKKLINGVVYDTNKMKKIIKVESWKWKWYSCYTIYLHENGKIILYEKFNNFYFLRVGTLDIWNYSMDLLIISLEDVYSYTERIKPELRFEVIKENILKLMKNKNEDTHSNNKKKRWNNRSRNAPHGLAFAGLSRLFWNRWQKRL